MKAQTTDIYWLDIKYIAGALVRGGFVEHVISMTIANIVSPKAGA
jgi:hypothetical protein